MERGNTEPNPNDDLDGADLGKKIVILARKAGYNIGLSDIVYGDGLLDTSFRRAFDGQDWKADGTKDAFIEKIRGEKDREMEDLINSKKPLVPRYVGSMTSQSDGSVRLSVGIRFVEANSELAVAQYNKLVVTVNRGNDIIDTRTLSGRGAGPAQTAQ